MQVRGEAYIYAYMLLKRDSLGEVKIKYDYFNPATAAPTLMGMRNLIEGFSTAMQYMVEGDDWMVFIPYNLAYGSAGSGKIPGYSTLQFRVNLVRWYESGSGAPSTWE